jgi:hypothetical protein
MIESNSSPFQDGYRCGYLAARDFVRALHARGGAGDAVAPNELGYILEGLHQRIDDAGGRTMAGHPISQRSADYQSLRGEYFGFCAGLLEVLRRQ